MAYLKDIPARVRTHVAGLECPSFEEIAFVSPAPAGDRRVALISSAGLNLRDDPRFVGGSADYRALPHDADRSDILMSHVSVNFDRSAFQQDINTVLPLDRMAELAAAAEIGSVAATHYSFMGATDPQLMQKDAAQVAGLLKADKVDTALLVPV